MRDQFLYRTRNIYRHQCERAEKNGTHIEYSIEELRSRVQPAIGTKCRYCKQTLTAASFSVDHYVPINRSTDFALANTMVICGPCNQRKGDMDEHEYSHLLAITETFHPYAKQNLLRRLRAGARIYRN